MLSASLNKTFPSFLIFPQKTYLFPKDVHRLILLQANGGKMVAVSFDPGLVVLFGTVADVIYVNGGYLPKYPTHPKNKYTQQTQKTKNKTDK